MIYESIIEEYYYNLVATPLNRFCRSVDEMIDKMKNPDKYKTEICNTSEDEDNSVILFDEDDFLDE